MRRIALVLATVATLGFGMAGTAAQAHDYGRGDYSRTQEWHEHGGREHRDWRAHGFERHVLPHFIYGMFAR
ncbi:MAG: hypothetical protein JO162_02575 [Alphaproteobacteria bacterium]|nr:hypothetical protein [Alphaproteobacteria bacterium]MBV9018797.1 hypothetical protein [Alphaproteobacteria bacterium]MBV9584753.1 hypothetical protein [Alphaproteobacteria bacterium]MBV9966290.1 hypothetical protein [Alphaproteobacteria bacterium]